MSEQELQRQLERTRDFMQRQRLLKQLWKLRRQHECETAANAPNHSTKTA